MYNQPYYKEESKKKILDFIEEYSFAFITGSFLSGEQVATQIPIMLDERNGELYLQGHIMRNSNHYKAFLENPNVLIVFTGPNCYVSATWYSNPHIGSTWNYMSVQVSGKIQFLTDNELKNFMRKLTLKFEQNNTHSQTVYDNLPESFLNAALPAIVGFEVKITHLENVFKLSQNQDEESFSNIINELEKKGGQSALIASEMQKIKPKVFPK